MTEWWQWVGWIVGIGSGLYGAWRAWRTDLKVRKLEPPWNIEHQGGSTYLLTNRQPRIAYGVVVRSVKARRVFWDGPRDMPIRGSHWFTSGIGFTEDEPVIIEWFRKRSRTGKPEVESIWLPGREKR